MAQERELFDTNAIFLGREGLWAREMVERWIFWLDAGVMGCARMESGAAALTG